MFEASSARGGVKSQDVVATARFNGLEPAMHHQTLGSNI
jgi:hypothetical protein